MFRWLFGRRSARSVDGDRLLRACRSGDRRAVVESGKAAHDEAGSFGVGVLLKQYECRGFREAAQLGHVDVVDALLSMAAQFGGDRLVRTLMEAREFEAFRRAAAGGHVEVIRRMVAACRDMDVAVPEWVTE